MFRFTNVFKSYEGNTVLGGVSFTLSKGECVGLIGANASGKTTLLSIAARAIEPDRGSVWIQPGKTIGHFSRDSQIHQDCSVGMFLAEQLMTAATDLTRLEHCLDGNTSWQSHDYERWQSEYAEAFEKFEILGGYAAIARLHSVLSGLGLSEVSFEESIDMLSGGQKNRLALARILMERPDLLLLDEPTNNLDVDSQEWLAMAINNAGSAVLVVSHDRQFLDSVASRIFEIQPLTGQMKEYGGNYSWFKQRKEQELDRQWRQYSDQQQRAEQLRKDIQATKNQALATELTTVHDYLRGRAKKVAAKAKAREKRLTKMLSGENKIEKPRETAPRVRMDLGDERVRTDVIIEAQDMRVGYNQKVLLQNINFSIFGNSRIAILGSNGCGKTTLIKTLVGDIPPVGGSLWRRSNVIVSYLAQDHSERLPAHKSVFDYFQEAVENSVGDKDLLSNANTRTFLNRFLFSGTQVFQTIDSLSQGQRIKLLLATFMAVRTELLILDEPTNFLDIPTRECLEDALSITQFNGALLLVSHDRFFLQRVGIEAVWVMSDGGMTQKPVDEEGRSPRKLVV